MNRLIELIRLVETTGPILGRKKLQKMVHILKEAGHPFEFRYQFHMHGPFSIELKSSIDSLVNEELLDESPDDSCFGDFRQYRYASNTQSRQLLRSVVADGQPEWAALANLLNTKPARDLEAISTILFLHRHGYPESNLKKRFEELKPQLADRFDVSVEFISQQSFPGKPPPRAPSTSR